MWGYREHGIEKEFDTEDELISYLQCVDTWTIRTIKYWYIENNFDLEELAHELVDGYYVDVTANDWLDEALDGVRLAFQNEEYDWKEETIRGIYYRDEGEEE